MLQGAHDVCCCSSTRKQAGQDAPGLRYISAGGSPSTLEAFHRGAGLPLNNGYGLTECSSNVAIIAARDDDSVGFPLPGVEICFVGADGVDVADGQIGELDKGPQSAGLPKLHLGLAGSGRG